MLENWKNRKRGRRMNPVVNDCGKQLPLLGLEGLKGPARREEEEGAGASGDGPFLTL